VLLSGPQVSFPESLSVVNTGVQCENIVYSRLTSNSGTVEISCHGFGPSFSVTVSLSGSLYYGTHPNRIQSSWHYFPLYTPVQKFQ
jgi:hypothetical protein